MLFATLVLGLLLVLISAYGYRISSKTAVDYLMAGRSIGTIVLFFYVYFAISSTWTFYGFPGTIYNTGPGFQLTFIFISFAFLYIFLGPKLWAAGKCYGYLSPVQYLGERYQSRALQAILGICLFMFLFPYLGIQAIGIGAGIQAYTGLPFWVGAAYMCVLMIVIVLLGGTRGVAWVNVVLGILFSVTFIGFLFWVCAAAGLTDLSEMARRVEEIRPGQLSVPGPTGTWNVKNLIGLAITGIVPFAWPHVVIGTMQAKSIPVMRKMTLGMLAFSLLFCGVALVWGMLATPVLVPGLEGKAADAVVQMAITKYLPSWAGALTLLAVLAAAISTASVQLMVAGIFLSRDIILVGKQNASDRELMIWARVGMLVAVAGSFIMALARPTELGLMLSNVASPGFAQWLPAFVGGLLWKRGTKYGAIAGTVTGVALLIIGSYFYKPLLLGFHPIVVPLAVNTAIYVILSLLTPPVSREVQDKFFDDLENWIEETRAREREEEMATAVTSKSM